MFISHNNRNKVETQKIKKKYLKIPLQIYLYSCKLKNQSIKKKSNNKIKTKHIEL